MQTSICSCEIIHLESPNLAQIIRIERLIRKLLISCFVTKQRFLSGLLLAGLLFTAATCGRVRTGDVPPEILGRWFHSFEEDTLGTNVYRPESFDFPLARGRTGFSLHEDGRFEQYDIAPTDGLETTPGTWQSPEKNTVRVQLDGVRKGRTASFQLQIVSVEKDRLVIRREQ